MKKPTPKKPRNIDKFLFEAGQQCQKRLWLDLHEPVEEEPAGGRLALSAAGEQLRSLARSAFPKGVTIEAETSERAAQETKEHLAAGTPVLFGATFVADGVEVTSDILVVHKQPGGAEGTIDLYEVKSGTKIKHRYVNDLALQTLVAETSGHRLRAAFLLHVNPKYAHKEGADFPPMQLLRSADVTAKVRKQVDLVRRRLQQFRQSIADDSVLQLPMGTYCTAPFPCPHLARCTAEGPARPLRELPELTRSQELELHKEGIEDFTGLDEKRPGLTFRQRRTLAAVQQNTPIIEPFVREELRQCGKPLHFLSLAALTDALPRFDGQRPWRQVPYAWAANTLHPDDRLETASFLHIDRTDPRPEFVATLAKHLEVGGTILCWNDETLNELRALLDDLPAAKGATRAVLGRAHVDMMQLFESGVFHPDLRDYSDLRTIVATLFDDDSGAELAVFGEDALRAALGKAWTPRIRSTTKEKIAADIKAGVTWASEQLLRLFRKFAEIEPQVPRPAAAKARGGAKPLPKPLPKP
ncbi:MAG TPA: DUF2779 domain-containing protein [Planctomycetota bacterium]|nr:DUF2779 domain-containing protein [Planctomycetota bacterium]